MYPELVISVIGLVTGFLITRKHPRLRKAGRSAAKNEKPNEISSGIKADSSPEIKLSVIIPISDDDGTLLILMNNLAEQTRPIDEIILVGDGTVDFVSDLVAVDSVRFVQTPPTKDSKGMPERTWDYISGADVADGDMLLFLSTVVHLERDAIQLLLQATINHRSGVPAKSTPIITIQPFCQTKRLCDNTALFANLIGSIGNFFPSKWSSRVIDPFSLVSLMTRAVYQSIRSQLIPKKKSDGTVDLDLEVDQTKGEEGIAYRHILGGQDIQARTDGRGFLKTLQRWITDTAPQILRIQPGVLMLVALWLIACTSIVIGLIQASLQTDAWPVLIYLALYLLTLVQLNLASRHVGRFSKSAIFFYPLWLAAFWVIFIISIFRNYVFSKSKSNQEETTL